MDYNNPFATNLIKRFEGYSAKPYFDHKQHSVGFGTRWIPGTPIGSKADHEAALNREAAAVDNWINQNVKAQMTPEQRAALTSFGYNVGTGKKGVSRLLNDINAGNWDRVGQRMLSFNKASGKVNEGLVNRRRQEVETLLGRALSPDAQPSSYQAQSAVARATGGSDMAAPIGGAPVAGGPVPLVPPNKRYSKLADLLMAQAAGQKVSGWGDAMRALGSTALGVSLADKADTQESDYRGKLSQALSGASGTDGLAQTLLSSGDPEMMQQGVALKVAQAKPQAQIGRFRATKQGVFDSTTGQIIPGTEAKGTDNAEYGTTPVPYIGADGKTYYTQISKAGGRKDIDLPEGAKWASGVDKVDVGTGTVLIDKKTGAQRETIDSNLAQAEAQKVVGKQAGEAQANLPAAKTTVENAFKTIAELEKHPGLEAGTGLSNIADPRSWTPGTDAYNFLAKNKQAQAQSFMGAREALKGAGQVTDFEGERGQTAIAALDAAQSKEQYLAALTDLKRMMQASYDDMQKKAGLAVPAQNPDMPKPVKTMRYNPQTGEIE